MPEVRPIAMGIAAHRVATPGDGVPGAVFEDLPLPQKNAVVFNFSDPTEVRIDLEGSNDPLYSGFVKDTTDFIEVSIPTPSNATIQKLAGGVHDKTGVEPDTNDEWQEPFEGVPDINFTYQCETVPRNGSKVVYTIVNAKVLAKLSQAPTADNPELLLVRFYKQAAISAAGVKGYAFSRKVVAVPAV